LTAGDDVFVATTVMEVFVAALLALFAVLLVFVGIYLTGLAPRRVLSLESRVLRLFKKRKEWSWTEIEPYVFLGSLPRWPSHLEELRALGVGAVLTLNELWEVGLSTVCIQEDCGMAHRQLPTPDFFAPSHRDIVEAVAFIQKHVHAGRAVFVHCNGGRGRSVVCVICYLLYEHGWTADQAFQYVKERRKIAKLKSMGGVRPQWRAVTRFASRLQEVHERVATGLTSGGWVSSVPPGNDAVTSSQRPSGSKVSPDLATEQPSSQTLASGATGAEPPTSTSSERPSPAPMPREPSGGTTAKDRQPSSHPGLGTESSDGEAASADTSRGLSSQPGCALEANARAASDAGEEGEERG